MNKYRINIYWSEEDQVFIAEVPELPGCITHGETRATARANAKRAIQGWVETAKRFGDSIPKPKEKHATSNDLAKAYYCFLSSDYGIAVRKNNPRSSFHAKALQPIMNPAAH